MKYIIDSPSSLTLQAESYQDRAWLANFFILWREVPNITDFIQARRESDSGFAKHWSPTWDTQDIVSVRILAPRTYGNL